MPGVFPLIMMSQPAGVTSAGAAVTAAGEQASRAAQSHLQSTNQLRESYSGGAAQAQSANTKSAVDRGLKVAEAAVKSAVVMKLFGEGMNRLKEMIKKVKMTAESNGFVVTPIGLVILGPTHYAQISAATYGAAALAAKFWAQAMGYNLQIIALEAAVMVLDYAQGQVLQKITGGISNSAGPGYAPSTVNYPNYMPPPGTNLSGPTTWPGAAPATTWADGEPTYGLQGAGALSGVGAGSLGAALSPGVIGGPLGSASPGLAGAHGGAVPAGVVAGAAAARAMPGGVMGMGAAGMGAHGPGRDDERGAEARLWTVQEDEDVWGAGSAAGPENGVLA
jgi:hypothetical protein